MDLAPRLLQRLFRMALRIFFRRVSVLGQDHIPAEGPLILVANHVNSLLDPLLLLRASPRPVRFLAKAPLFHHPLVAPFLKALRALPVQRRQDEGSDMAQNARTFEACEQSLAAGEAVALFPEGLSHNEPSLQPVKTGAARIAGRALKAGAEGLAILPVGLVFEEKAVFRSEVTAVVGLPVPCADLDFGEGEAPEAVTALTERIAAALHSVTVNAERWDDLRFVEALRPMALELLGAEEEELPRAEARRLMLESYYRAREEHPRELALLMSRMRHYARLLRLLRLEDADVAREASAGPALAYAWKRLALLVAGYPLALYGWLFNAAPYALTAPVANAFSRQEDVVATYKLGLGTMLFLFYYAGMAAGLDYLLGPWASAALVLLGIPAGLWALHYFEAREEFLHMVRAVLTLGTRRRAAAQLQLLRRGVLDALDPLVHMYR